MPLASRRGDRSECPHQAQGPAVEGSPDVQVNSRLALRVGDTGAHPPCCNDETWHAKTGATRVLINGKLAMRTGDAVRHGGAQGKMIDGSPNVMIGDRKGRKPRQEAPARPEEMEEVAIHIVDPFGNEAERSFFTGEVYVQGAIHEEEHVFTKKGLMVRKGHRTEALFYHTPPDFDEGC